MNFDGYELKLTSRGINEDHIFESRSNRTEKLFHGRSPVCLTDDTTAQHDHYSRLYSKLIKLFFRKNGLPNKSFKQCAKNVAIAALAVHYEKS
jgi:hypothetical protein